MLPPMPQRPTSTLGLFVHVVKLRLASLGRTQRIVLFGVLLVAAAAAGAYGRCLLGADSCPASGGCPMMSAGETPCGR